MKALLAASLLVGLFSSSCYSSDAEEFVGRWVLDTIEVLDATGEWVEYDNPEIGLNPIGYIHYDSAGYMSVQMMRRNKIEDGPNYIAYYATYEIIEEESVVLHHTIGNFLGEPGSIARRAYILDENTLTLMPTDSRRVRWIKR